MNTLIVYAHPEPKSFNGALKDLAISVLTEQGHKVKVSDLYAMNFKAVANRDDFEDDQRDRHDNDTNKNPETTEFTHPVCPLQIRSNLLSATCHKRTSPLASPVPAFDHLD